MQFRTSPALLAAFCAVGASIVLVACGGSSSSSSSASAYDSALKFSKCMREHGIKDFPDPETAPGGGTRLDFKGVNGEGASGQTVKAAQKACGHFQGEGETRELSPQQKAEAEDTVEKFAKCMREHGIEVKTQIGPGRIVAQIGGPGPGPRGPNPESPVFKAAQKACKGLMQGPKGAVTPGPSGPGG
jgi:hypothetical protein